MIFVGFFYALTLGAPLARATRVLHTLKQLDFRIFYLTEQLVSKMFYQIARDAPPIDYFIKKHRHRHLQPPILIN